MAGGMKKFSENTYPIPEVMDSNTLKFSRLIFWGTPSPFGCVLASLGQSVERVKIWGGSTPKGQNVVSQKSPLGCKFIKVNNFFDSGPKYTSFFSSNVGGVVDFHELFWFSICWSVPEILAIKSHKLSKIAPNFGRFFAVTNFMDGPCKNCTHVITPVSRDVDWKTFREDTPTSPEVIDLKTLNFRPNFKFSLSKFFWRDPIPPWSVR